MSSIAEQATGTLGGRWSVLTRQKKDHIVLEQLLSELEAASEEGRHDVLRRIYRLVFPHAFAEEAVLWPVLRRVLPEGEELTLRVEEEHQEINALVARLARLEGDALSEPARAVLIARLVGLLRQDVRDEEDVLLPRLQAELPDGHLRLLGLWWELVRRTAPTRSHPAVARRPPGNVLAALPLSLADRLRDRVDHLAPRAPQPVAAGLRSTQRVLARIGNRVETLGVMTAGERPETRRIDEPTA